MSEQEMSVLYVRLPLHLKQKLTRILEERCVATSMSKATIDALECYIEAIESITLYTKKEMLRDAVSRIVASKV